MTVSIELDSEEVQRLEAAGIDLATLLRGLAASLPATPAQRGLPSVQSPDEENAAAIALLSELNHKGATDTSEVLQQAETELSTLLDNLNANRLLTGERPLFPVNEGSQQASSDE